MQYDSPQRRETTVGEGFEKALGSSGAKVSQFGESDAEARQEKQGESDGGAPVVALKVEEGRGKDVGRLIQDVNQE